MPIGMKSPGRRFFLLFFMYLKDYILKSKSTEEECQRIREKSGYFIITRNGG